MRKYKGEFGYIAYRKKITTVRTVICLAVSVGIFLIGLIISFFVRIDYYRKLKKKFASGYYNDDYWHIKGFIIYVLLIVPVILFLFINNR